ncbi:MAG: SPOR domain-containing protein [Candidatus Omnitrophota bacterium]
MLKKSILFFFVLISLFFSGYCLASELDLLKADFLRGNYRRVIFEGQSQMNKFNFKGGDELSYLVGLSYLKLGDLAAAEESFKRVLKDAQGQLITQARLGLADTYLIGGQLLDAEDNYNKIIIDQPDTHLKAAILYRQSWIGFKKGNNAQGNEYLSKLKKDFPACPELKSTLDILQVYPTLMEDQEYSVQVGFFANQENADNFTSKLSSRGFPAYLEQAGSGWRVKVGRFKHEQEAIDLESKLAQEGFLTKVCP